MTIKKFLCGTLMFISLMIFTSCTNVPAQDTPVIMRPSPYINFDFPSLHINLPGDPFCDRDVWLTGSMSLTDTHQAYAFYDRSVQVRGRGNTTWFYGQEKRPLRFRFESEYTMFYSTHAHRNWILLANHFDRAMMRNHGAFELARTLHGMDWSPMSVFVHLYINGEYAGVYQLTDERDVGPGRAELTYHENPRWSGFFIELDGHNAEITAGERTYTIRWPSGNSLTDHHTRYVTDYLQSVSNAIRRHRWGHIMSLVDIDSFVDFYIVQELWKNQDIGNYSVFMHINGTGRRRRLHMGPVWDFDQTSGNTDFVSEPEGLLAARDNYWFRYLMEMPQFQVLVRERWNEIRHHEVQNTIDNIAMFGRLYYDAFNRNFERHPYIMGDPFAWNWVESTVTSQLMTFGEQVDFFVSFLNQRANWLDDFFNA